MEKEKNFFNFNCQTYLGCQPEMSTVVREGRVAPPKKMNFWKSKKGVETHFQTKNLYCRFWTITQGFKQGLFG